MANSSIVLFSSMLQIGMNVLRKPPQGSYAEHQRTHWLKPLIAISLLLLSLAAASQTKLLLSDTSIVGYYPSTEWEDIDSLVYIHSGGGDCTLCDDYLVYFDNEFQNIAYVSQSFGDTCVVQDFWRNGNLKRKTVYLKHSDGFPIWWFDEIYCQNGQVIFKGPSPNQPGKKLFINYHCNGTKKLEFYHEGMGADGKMTWWYANGKLESESYYDNNEPTGEWKYWNEDGLLIKTERYEAGKLVETINYER